MLVLTDLALRPSLPTSLQCVHYSSTCSGHVLPDYKSCCSIMFLISHRGVFHFHCLFFRKTVEICPSVYPSRSCTKQRDTSWPVRPTPERCTVASWSRPRTIWTVRLVLTENAEIIFTGVADHWPITVSSLGHEIFDNDVTFVIPYLNEIEAARCNGVLQKVPHSVLSAQCGSPIRPETYFLFDPTFMSTTAASWV